MKRAAAYPCFVLALLTTGPSSAQDVAPSAAPVLTASPTAGCRLGDHVGFDDADAQTAAHLVCAELWHGGVSAGANYRVSLGKLGSVVILFVAREGDGRGSTIDSREMRLRGIEEVSVAAPRIAESIARGIPLSETERVDNLVGEETRKSGKKPGSVHFALGLIGNLPPLDQGIGPAPGADLSLHYETKTFELGGGIRFGGGQVSSTSPTMGFFMASVGARYFVNDTDFTPYVGGGLAWDYLSLATGQGGGGPGFTGSNDGLGAYAEAGIEVLRTHHAHLSAGIRFDLPFFSLKNQSNYNDCAEGVPCSLQEPASMYYAPLSLGIRLTF